MIRILVCDDQALVRAGYVTIFGAQPDMEVVGEAGDGRTVVEEAARLRPDVVVMDVQLPVLDGIEVTRLLAGPSVPEPVKILLVTTVSRDEYVYRALRSGASGFLLKQASAAEMVSAVRSIAMGEAVLAPKVTRRLIGRFAARIRPETPRAGRLGEPLDSLSQRELEVLRLVAIGMSNAEVAATMVIGRETVKTYMARIFAKLGVRDRVQAVIRAYRAGLVTFDD